MDIAAPGEFIISLDLGGGTRSGTGTSFAGPYVAGACALLLSAYPTLNVDQIYDILMETVDPIEPGICSSNGRLNLFKALSEPEPAAYYVDGDANGANDGSSWEDAFNHLQDALSAVSGGKEIRVAEGIYEPDANSSSPDGSGDRNATFQLVNLVRIKGGYAGAGASDPNERNIALYETTLSGDLDGDDGPGFVNNAENSYHVVTGSGTDATAVLDGFTITGGNADGGVFWVDDSGGGMYNLSCSPMVSNCTFRENSATGTIAYTGGGGMWNADSYTTVINCTFTGNSAESAGGGVYNWLSDPVFTSCTFSGNQTASGGAMYNDSSYPTVSNCILWGDTPDEIAVNLSTPVVTYSDVQGGWAGAGNIDADPCFVQAGYWDDNGTAGEPNDDFWVAGDYHLQPDIPCIDVGDNNTQT